MTCSGILVHAAPGDLSALAARLAALPGICVHQQDPATGRLVLTLEAATADDEIAGLRRVQQAPGVASANLVYHRLEAEPGAAEFNVPEGDTP